MALRAGSLRWPTHTAPWAERASIGRGALSLSVDDDAFAPGGGADAVNNLGAYR